ncbi:protein phosphatase 2C domain-containing protein [Nocardia sp. CWNU-33]|uniref:protein phosphatase 2C domain-containing protein n=1 Tax=Nocardia sp. CWNU-33 TaxID=3392117 RepID=UPI00398F2520
MAVISALLGSVAKDGRDDDENEDRAAAGRYRFAVADGATDAARPEVWAEILVAAFVRTWPTSVGVFEARELARLREQWRSAVYRPGLPWHATMKLDCRPAAAAFVGVEIDVLHGCYVATAVGDSCVLHVRRGELLSAGPLEDWRQFGSYPPLVKATAGDETFRTALWRCESRYQPGDVLILATDALAKYFLRHYEMSEKLDIDECRVESNDAFSEWVADARLRRGLDNDDTTICVVAL